MTKFFETSITFTGIKFDPNNLTAASNFLGETLFNQAVRYYDQHTQEISITELTGEYVTRVLLMVIHGIEQVIYPTDYLVVCDNAPAEYLRFMEGEGDIKFKDAALML